jgi:dihydrodipicolinate synthase/N-acetylneuraminate lyase
VSVVAGLSGVLPVIQTPFLDDGAIDEATLTRELHWVLDQGVAGLTTGMVTEILRLDDAERRRLTEIVADVARERRAVSVVSCGAESTRVAVSHARHAEHCGADAVMAISPISVALDDDELYSYFASVAEATTIGLVVQDASGYVGRPLSVSLQVRLLETYGDRIYFKPEAPPIGQRVSELRDATNAQARVFEGTAGAALADTFERGVVGSMPGAEVCWAVQALWTALVAGDRSLVEQISGPLSRLVDLQPSLDAFVAVEKFLLVEQGVFASVDVRGPVGFHLDEESRVQVRHLVDQLRGAVRPS